MKRAKKVAPKPRRAIASPAPPKRVPRASLVVTCERVNPELAPLLVRIETLVLDPENAREHSPRSVQAIAFSLSRFGQQKPIVTTRQGVVVAGNGLVMAATDLGWKLVAAVRLNTDDPTEARAYALADNRSAELSNWNEAALAESIEALKKLEFPLDDLGWTVDELKPISLDGGKAVESRAEVVEDDDDDEAGELTEDDELGKPVPLTRGQRTIFEGAVEKMRQREADPEISEGRVVELLCAEYLS